VTLSTQVCRGGHLFGKNVLENQEVNTWKLCENAQIDATPTTTVFRVREKVLSLRNYAADGYVDAANYVECQQLERQETMMMAVKATEQRFMLDRDAAMTEQRLSLNLPMSIAWSPSAVRMRKNS
jgi:hypothetical protein